MPKLAFRTHRDFRDLVSLSVLPVAMIQNPYSTLVSIQGWSSYVFVIHINNQRGRGSKPRYHGEHPKNPKKSEYLSSALGKLDPFLSKGRPFQRTYQAARPDLLDRMFSLRLVVKPLTPRSEADSFGRMCIRQVGFNRIPWMARVDSRHGATLFFSLRLVLSFAVCPLSGLAETETSEVQP